MKIRLMVEIDERTRRAIGQHGDVTKPAQWNDCRNWIVAAIEMARKELVLDWKQAHGSTRPRLPVETVETVGTVASKPPVLRVVRGQDFNEG